MSEHVLQTPPNAVLFAPRFLMGCWRAVLSLRRPSLGVLVPEKHLALASDQARFHAVVYCVTAVALARRFYSGLGR